MEPKMTILFIGKKSRTTKQDLLPIYLRATIKGKRFEAATHHHVKPSEWEPSAGKVKGRSGSAMETNMALDLIKKQVYDYKEQIISEARDFTVSALREKWFGEDRDSRTLLGVFRSSILELEKLVAKGRYKSSTLTKYRTTEKHLTSFIAWRDQGKDILLQDLRMDFAKHFEFYVQTEKNLSINSSGRMITNLKKIICDCVDKDWLDKNPFLRFKVRHIDPKVPHLTAQELKLIEEKEITIKRLALVRDMFLFSCYTGFAYIDVANLTLDHIKDAYLKELSDICGIETQITFHIARHTFASTVALENGVPIDSVSKMLGHRNIKTTQIYARVSDRKISEDTEVLFRKLMLYKSNPAEKNLLF
jgi:site-specific recombinase XerD